MEKAIYSRVNLKNRDTLIANEYYDSIYDLIDKNEVQMLKQYTQHMFTSRFQHCINVSYYSFLIAKKLNLDAYSAARAGLLHDLYYYDWKTDDQRPYQGNHAKIHPIIALENTKKMIETNESMDDAIIHHMWPLKTTHPKTSIGWIVQGVDKYCAILEIYSSILMKNYHSNHITIYAIIITFLLTH